MNSVKIVDNNFRGLRKIAFTWNW